jgi:hypothetical protein
MYNDSTKKHHPTIRNVVRSTCSRRDAFEVVMKPPQQRCPGGHFYDAVQSETDQGDGPGDCPGDDGSQPFKTVVSDCEVFEPLTPANQFMAVGRDRGCHLSIITAQNWDPPNKPYWIHLFNGRVEKNPLRRLLPFSF